MRCACSGMDVGLLRQYLLDNVRRLQKECVRNAFDYHLKDFTELAGLVKTCGYDDSELKAALGDLCTAMDRVVLLIQAASNRILMDGVARPVREQMAEYEKQTLT